MTKVLLVAACAGLVLCAKANMGRRVLVPVEVNGHPATLRFDTSSAGVVLWKSSLDAIGVGYTNPPSDSVPKPGLTRVAIAEECVIKVFDVEFAYKPGAYEPPAAAVKDLDGLIGWKLFWNNIIRMSPHEAAITIEDRLPDDIAEWNAWAINTNVSALAFHVPELGSIHINTTDPTGLSLATKEWKRYLQREQPKGGSIVAGFSSVTGFTVSREYWMRECAVGALALEGLPVSKSTSGAALRDKAYAGTLGMYALTRMEVIVDGKGGRVFTRLAGEPHDAYAHNRLGAAFVPPDIRSAVLLAHVVPNGPAWRAGIRDGDRLVAIDGVDFTRWRTMPNREPFSAYWRQPAGVKLELTVARDGERMVTVVELEDLLPPRMPADED